MPIKETSSNVKRLHMNFIHTLVYTLINSGVYKTRYRENAAYNNIFIYRFYVISDRVVVNMTFSIRAKSIGSKLILKVGPNPRGPYLP